MDHGTILKHCGSQRVCAFLMDDIESKSILALIDLELASPGQSTNRPDVPEHRSANPLAAVSVTPSRFAMARHPFPYMLSPESIFATHHKQYAYQAQKKGFWRKFICRPSYYLGKALGSSETAVQSFGTSGKERRLHHDSAVWVISVCFISFIGNFKGKSP